MIHRAPFGSMERFVAVLIEHTGGKFPLVADIRIRYVIMPISEKFNEYAWDSRPSSWKNRIFVFVVDGQK